MHFIRRKESNIFIPKGNKPDISVGCTFQLEKFKSDGTITYKGPIFPNTILNSGLDLLASYSVQAIGTYCNVGTGTSTPVETQTGLDSFRAAHSTMYSVLAVSYITAAPVHIKHTRTFSFAIGTVTGNLTEVGLSRLSNSNYFNRQLFKDLNGDPATITVLADEGIRVTAIIYIYPDMATGDEINGSFTFNGATIDYIKRMNLPHASSGFLFTAANGLSDAGVIGNIGHVQGAEISTAGGLTFPDGSNASSYVQAAYVPGSFERTCTYKWLAGILVGNLRTITTCVANTTSLGNRLYSFELTPTLAKSDTEEFTITTKRTWGRYVAP